MASAIGDYYTLDKKLLACKNSSIKWLRSNKLQIEFRRSNKQKLILFE
jgi:hypothetical protein